MTESLQHAHAREPLFVASSFRPRFARLLINGSGDCGFGEEKKRAEEGAAGSIAGERATPRAQEKVRVVYEEEEETARWQRIQKRFYEK